MVAATPRDRLLVRRRMEQQMLGTVRIQRGKLGTLDPTTGVVGGLNNLSVIYEGKARVWSVDGGGVISTGNGQIDTRTTYVSIPVSAPVPHRDDIVTVLNDDLSDDDLDNRVFRIMEVDGGGYISETRRLTCSSFFPNRWWTTQ